MRFLAASVLALCCAAAAPSAAAPSGGSGSVDWKSAGVARQYRCRIPPAWEGKPASEGSMRYGDGSLAVSVVRHAGKEDSLEPILRSLGSPRPEAAGTVTVSGLKARLFKRQYLLHLTGDESPRPETEWLYEEIALVPAAPDGFWILSFESPSLTHRQKPAGLALWRKFLKGFRLEP